MLSTRFLPLLSIEEQSQFSHSLFLAPTKETVHGHNMAHLTCLGNPVAKICALHNCGKAAQGTEDAAQGLQTNIYLSRGSRVMLRSNLWTAHGLVNGATGTVDDIIYSPHTKPPTDQPLCVMVKFDRYTGPSFHHPQVVPICPMTRAWTEKETKCTRVQFPLQLAWAVTIHKCQGMTLDSAVISLGAKEFATGMSFVGLSRVRALKNLMINPAFPFERIGQLHLSKSLQQRKLEETRQATMSL